MLKRSHLFGRIHCVKNSCSRRWNITCCQSKGPRLSRVARSRENRKAWSLIYLLWVVEVFLPFTMNARSTIPSEFFPHLIKPALRKKNVILAEQTSGLKYRRWSQDVLVPACRVCEKCCGLLVAMMVRMISPRPSPIIHLPISGNRLRPWERSGAGKTAFVCEFWRLK